MFSISKKAGYIDSRKNTDVLLSNMDCPGHRADSGGAAKSLALHNNADCWPICVMKSVYLQYTQILAVEWIM